MKLQQYKGKTDKANRQEPSAWQSDAQGQGVITVHRCLRNGKTNEREGLFCLVTRTNGKNYKRGISD